MGEKEGQEVGFYVNGKQIGKATDAKVELCSKEDETFQGLYDNKGYEVSFSVTANEDATAFFNRMMVEKYISTQKALTTRIEYLFKEFVNLNDEITDKDRKAFYLLFELGYSLGWNDYKNLIENKDEI